MLAQAATTADIATDKFHDEFNTAVGRRGGKFQLTLSGCQLQDNGQHHVCYYALGEDVAVQVQGGERERLVDRIKATVKTGNEGFQKIGYLITAVALTFFPDMTKSEINRLLDETTAGRFAESRPQNQRSLTFHMEVEKNNWILPNKTTLTISVTRH
ncbi:hypothetical protein [Pseudorhodoplanes sp.]|uniref:hypothetical protein n=1 Tax=Pseudorhodoplanes sp. TaxID=1934341 RepID=UPI003D0C1C15